MSCLDNDIRNPLRRDGTCRPDRWFLALGEAFVKIDERSESDLQDLAKAIASGILFFDLNNQPNQDWSAFFDKSVPDAAPHMALFKAFLTMFAQAQNHINTLTRSHLEYYYHTVLQLEPKAAVPDKAVIVWELAKNVQKYLLKPNTPLNGGKDLTKVDRIYRTARDLVVNRAFLNAVEQLSFDKYSLLIDAESREFTKPFSKKLATSKGQLADMAKNGEHWQLFGKQQYNLADADRTMDDAEIGFAVAHPVLLMAEGKRIVTLTMNFSTAFMPSKIYPSNSFNKALNFYLSGEGQWLLCTINSFAANGTNTQLTVQLELPITAPAVVPFASAGLPESFNTPYAVLKSTLNTSQELHGAYDVFASAILSSINISVDVSEMRSLLLMNDFGVLDAAKPFQPFGPQPLVGSTLRIGSAEAFCKRLTEFKLKIKWHGLPNVSLGAHYNWLTVNNASFKCSLNILYGKKEVGVTSADKQLFDGSNATSDAEITVADVLNQFSSKSIAYQQIWSESKLEPYNNSTQNGFCQLRLTQPAVAFGHKLWPSNYAANAISLAKNNTGTLPNEPYTPTIKQLELSYKSSETLDFNVVQQVGQFYHVLPFGVASPKPVAGQVSLLQPSELGHLYLGFKELAPPASLTLWFQMEEGSEDPLWDLQPNQLVWSYLAGNVWKDFSGLEIYTDTTVQMTASGMMAFQIPATALAGSTLNDGEHYWLRLSVKKTPHFFGKVVAVHTQVTLAEFEDSGNDPNHLRYPLPPESIKKMQEKAAEVKALVQPHASFGGRVTEQPEDFIMRVAERLRHHDRAVCIWDYERLVLERFTQIYKVKCLNTFRETSGIQPCNVTLIVMENLINRNPVNPLKPLTEKRVLLQIAQFLLERTSPWLQLAVENPIYEEVKVYCDVMFRQGYDPSYFQSQLNEELKRFLTPWAFEEGVNVVFGGRIYKSSILTFIEERYYVDFVTNFRVEHIAPAEGIGCMVVCEDFIVGDWYRSMYGEVIEALTDKSVLVSSAAHELKTLTVNDDPCNNSTLVIYDPCVACD